MNVVAQFVGQNGLNLVGGETIEEGIAQNKPFCNVLPTPTRCDSWSVHCGRAT